MDRGFIQDQTYGARLVSHFSTGIPQKSFWTGTKAAAAEIPIGVFRCTSCGFLELFARDEFAAE